MLREEEVDREYKNVERKLSKMPEKGSTVDLYKIRKGEP